MSCPLVVLNACQRATWRKTFYKKNRLPDDSLEAEDLTGYAAKFSVAEEAGGAAVISVSTEDDITITAAQGRIDVHLDEAQTSLLTGTRYFYTLMLYSPSDDAIRLVNGPFIVSKGITGDQTPPA